MDQSANQGNVNFAFSQFPASANSYGMNQQGSCGQNHFGQPMQQDTFVYNQQQNPCPSNLQSVPAGNPCICPSGISQPQMIPCNSFLPQNILDQIRTCVGNTASIFILPSSQPIQPQQLLPQVQQNPINVGLHPPIGYPCPLGTGYPGMVSSPVSSPPCYPFPVPIPFTNPFGNQNRSQLERSSTSCDCCRRISNSASPSSWEENEPLHRCCPGSDDAICTKANCPASVNLQALASQLLSVQGVIPCAATRLVMRRVPGSKVTTTVEETMERAQKAIGSLNRDQLITEARNAQQVNGLINLHMIASPPQNIVPVLTMVQLKVNSLKALVERLVNKSLSECQTVGNAGFDPAVLSTKSDAEIRELLATLRQRECEERVNVGYAPYHSQRVVAESRLASFQNKISQAEAEMERRRTAAMPWDNFVPQFNQAAFSGPGYQCSTLQEAQGFNPSFNSNQASHAGGKEFESPSPFMVQVQSPRRLNLKPNVGGPQTTYHQSSDERSLASPEAFAVSKLEKETKGCIENRNSCCREEQESAEPSREASDLGKGGTEGKKKLKIHVDERGELSVKKQSLEGLDVGEFVQLSPDVVIVIDKSGKDEDGSRKRLKKKKKKKGTRSVRKKSAESIPSNSTCDSETSVSSQCSEAEKEPRSKSVLKKILKGKKKTPIDENEPQESISHDTLPEPCSDRVKSKSIKKEKHVSVAMTPSEELCSYDQEELDIVRKNSDCKSHAVSKEISYSVMRDVSSNSINFAPKLQARKSSLVQKVVDEKGNCSLEKPVQQLLLKEAQNQTVQDYCIRSSYIVGSTKKLLQGSALRDNKENVSENPKTCSILGKKTRDNETLEGSASSNVGRDHRRKHNYRFK